MAPILDNEDEDNDACCDCDHTADSCVGCEYYGHFQYIGVEYP